MPAATAAAARAPSQVWRSTAGAAVAVGDRYADNVHLQQADMAGALLHTRPNGAT